MIEELSDNSSSSKKRDDPKIPCKYCTSEVRKSNMSAHVNKNCQIFSLWGRTKDDIDKLIEGESLMVESLKSMKKSLEEENEKLEQKLEEIGKENLALKNQNMELEELAETKGNFRVKFSANNMKTLIDQSGVSERTKASYLQVWTAYLDWCGWMGEPTEIVLKNQKNPFLVSTANEYLNFYFNQEKQYTATLGKVRNIIQNLIRKLTSRNVILWRFRGPIKFKREKNSLSKEQLESYLRHLQEKSSETYLPQLIQAKIGGRINSIANIEKRHLRFLFDPSSTKIILPDSKTGHIEKYIDEETREILKKYCEKNEELIRGRGGFIFYAGTSGDHHMRSRYLGKKVNSELKEYAEKINLANLTSHDLRRSYCEMSLNEIQAKTILAEVSKRIGHKNPRVTKNHYLSPKSLSLNIEEILDNIIKTRNSDTIEPIEDSDLLQKKTRRAKTPKSANSGMIVEENEGKNNFKFNAPKNPTKGPRPPRPDFVVSPIRQFNELTLSSLNSAIAMRDMELSENLIYYTREKGKNVKIQQMREADFAKYQEFKENAKNGIYPPLEVLHSEELGFYVKARGMIKRNTLLAEYTGEVVEHKSIPESDSIMELIATKNSSLVIYPDKIGNLAKFISGINEEDKKKRSKENVKSIKYNINGGIHVLLFAKKNIVPGQILYYNYNSGSRKEYPTSGFK